MFNKIQQILAYKNSLWFFFAFMVVAQLFVPASIVYEQEDIIATGTSYKMLVKPIDPHDLLRGKYVYLRFKEDDLLIDFEAQKAKEFHRGQDVFAIFSADNEGFLHLIDVSSKRPKQGQIYIKTELDWVGSGTKIRCEYVNNPKTPKPTDAKVLQECQKAPKYLSFDLNYNFNRFYMNEFKAQLAEETIATVLAEEEAFISEEDEVAATISAIPPEPSAISEKLLEETIANNNLNLTPAEQKKLQRKKSRVYAHIKTKNGKVSLIDLYINEKPIRNYLKSLEKNNSNM